MAATMRSTARSASWRPCTAWKVCERSSRAGRRCVCEANAFFTSSNHRDEMLMRPLRDILRLDEVTAVFEEPESATEFGRAFCDLLLARLPISLCALVLGPRHAA